MVVEVVFRIHPLVDGNGRTARLLLNFELMRSGYPIAVIKQQDRPEHYAALDKSQVQNNYTPEPIAPAFFRGWFRSIRNVRLYQPC